MALLALAKLPDRSPVRRTIVCEPGLNRALEAYAVLYKETYGETESVETLIPFMLTAFLARDRVFGRFRNASAELTAGGGARRRDRRGRQSPEPG